MTTIDTISRDTEEVEHAAVIAYSVLQSLQSHLAQSADISAIASGMALGLAMFLDETVGPFRAQRMMSEAPGIVVSRDAHVTPAMIRNMRAALARRAA